MIENRLPSGSPAGGQFTEKHRTQPEVPLANLTEGSFLYPPIDYGPNGAESYIAFWENAPITDRVLSNLITAYRICRDRYIEASLENWSRDYQFNDKEFLARKHKVNIGKFDEDEHRRLYEVKRTEKLAEIRATRPIVHIPSTQVRGIAVAARMYQCSGSFSDEEKAIIRSHEVQFQRGGQPERVSDIWQKYHLDECSEMAFTDQDLAVQFELSEIRRFSDAYTYV